jgi:uncharacterized phage protein gp47/JayE
MSNYSENNDFNDILTRLLARVDDSLDKRQGSIIYDALAPAAAELAQCYIALDVYTDQTYLLTAAGENLDARAVDYGLTRKEATPSEKLLYIYDTLNSLMDVPIGSRFSMPNEYGGYVFKVTRKYSTGKFYAECETPGSVANSYVGTLLPLTSINNLGQVIINSTWILGEDRETDTQLRTRILNHVRQKPFAGNRAYYREVTDAIEGVGGVRIFSAANGGGTVKLAIVSSDYTIPDQTLINRVQSIICPQNILSPGMGKGLAPIGHEVTVVPAEAYTVDIKVTINYTGATFDSIKNQIIEKIQNYLSELRAGWEDAVPTSSIYISDEADIPIYRSKITSLAFEVEGVTNVAEVKINNQNADLTIPINSTHPYFPITGEVTVSALI